MSRHLASAGCKAEDVPLKRKKKGKERLGMSHWKNHIVLFQIYHTAVQRLAMEGTGSAWRTGAMDALLEHEGETPKPPAWGLDAALMLPRGCWRDPPVPREGLELSSQGQHGRRSPWSQAKGQELLLSCLRAG